MNGVERKAEQYCAVCGQRSSDKGQLGRNVEELSKPSTRSSGKRDFQVQLTAKYKDMFRNHRWSVLAG